jgi:ParB-like chromosome segregation protein Spo0J
MSNAMTTDSKALEKLIEEANAISIPAARAFPIPTGKRWEEFFASIRDNGQKHPIILDTDNRIVDGRCRWIACKLLGREPKVEHRALSSSESIKEVIAGNIVRRHDDPGTIAIETAKLRKMLQEAASRDPENFPVVPSQAKMAEVAGIADRTLRDGEHLVERDPVLADQVSKQNITLNAAREIDKLPIGTEREEAIKSVQVAADKKAATAVVKKFKKKSTARIGKTVMFDEQGRSLLGYYSRLLAVIKSIRVLPHELRNLHKYIDTQPLAPSQAFDLKAQIIKIRKIDFQEFMGAVDVAVSELNNIIGNYKPQDDPTIEPELEGATHD